MAELGIDNALIPDGSVAVDITSTDHTCHARCVALEIGGAGDVKYDMAGEGTGLTLTVPAGKTLVGRFSKVHKTGTTATNIMEFYRK